MNGQLEQCGTLYINDSKMDELFRDIKRVTDQAGLFAIRQMRVYDETFDLLCSPESSAEIISFDYSYFENVEHDKVTIDFKTGNINIGNTGFAQFESAVQALSILVESYSELYCYTDNRSGLCQNEKLRWLSQILCRPITLPCHSTIWDVYERFVRDNGENQTLSAMEFFNSYEGDETNFDAISTIVYVNDTINEEYIENCLNQNEPVDKSSYGYWVRSMARFLWLAKRDSAKSEKDLLSRYMRLLHNISKIRAQIAAGVDVSPVKEMFATLAPPVTIKLIATIYNLDFWQLWSDNKDKIGVTSSIFYDGSTEYKTEDENINLEPITTEDFFGVKSEDRLYWWKEDGDVIISDKTQRWLDQMSEQHRSHIETMADEFSAIDWHQRLVKLLGKHKDVIKMFEHLYCEFLNAFHLKEYRAWIEMLEVLAESDISECRRLIAVLANNELRIKVFGS